MDRGIGSFLSSSQNDKGLLFIPFPVRQLYKHWIDNFYDDFGPLFICLFKEIYNYLCSKKKELVYPPGKKFKEYICFGLEYYSMYHKNSKLSDICRSHSDGEVFSWELEPISGLSDISRIKFCPSVLTINFKNKITLKCIGLDSKKSDLYHRFSEIPSCFYRPTSNFNTTADLIGVLNVKESNKTKVKRLILFN